MRAIPLCAFDQMDVLQSRCARFDRLDDVAQHCKIGVDWFRLTVLMLKTSGIEDVSCTAQPSELLPCLNFVHEVDRNEMNASNVNRLTSKRDDLSVRIGRESLSQAATNHTGRTGNDSAITCHQFIQSLPPALRIGLRYRSAPFGARYLGTPSRLGSRLCSDWSTPCAALHAQRL